jgi:hypothetical protein
MEAQTGQVIPINLTLQEIKGQFYELLELKDHHVVDVLVATVIANKIKGDPVWILFVAAPARSKTETISSLREVPDVLFLANMTPQTLISGRRVRGKNQSLLTRPDFKGKLKILAMKDFTTVLTTRSEPMNEILAQLREVYDGQYSKAFGTGELVDWEGKIGFIGGVTQIVDKHLALHQLLGERFLFYRIDPDDRTRIGHKAKRLAGKEGTHRAEIKELMAQFLSQFNQDYEPLPMSDELENKLVALADLCTALRTAVPRDKYSKTVEYVPEAEGPARMVKQLYLLGSGIGIANGKKEFDAEVYEVIKKVGRDSVPASRRLLIEALFKEEERNNKWSKTADLADLVGIPSSTALLTLEDMMMVKLLNRQKTTDDTGDDDYHSNPGRKQPYYWAIEDRSRGLIETSEVFTTPSTQPEGEGNDIPF